MNQYKAIVIAAGMGNRLRPLTENSPKCMLEIKGKTLLDYSLTNFRTCGIEDISVITGHAAAKINDPSLKLYHNADYQHNNILHSLMYARTELEQALSQGQSVIISYSDIWFSQSILALLMDSQQNMSLAIDPYWERQYIGRTDNPPTAAEVAVFSATHLITKIGKNISWSETEQEGEVIGLLMLRPQGIRDFLNYFDAIDAKLSLDCAFQHAPAWRQSYITDLFQGMLNENYMIHCVPITQEMLWKEFDTVQDFEGGLPF